MMRINRQGKISTMKAPFYALSINISRVSKGLTIRDGSKFFQKSTEDLINRHIVTRQDLDKENALLFFMIRMGPVFERITV